MSKRTRYYLIHDVLTVISEFVDKWTYPQCCLVNKEWYQIFKRFNKSFSFYYMLFHSGPGGCPRTEYFVCNTLEETKIAITEDLYTGNGFYYFTFQKKMRLVKVMNDGEKIKLDLHPFITIEYPNKFGNIPIRFKLIKIIKRKRRTRKKIVFEDRKKQWSKEDKKRLDLLIEEVGEMNNIERDIFRNEFKIDIDMDGIAKVFGGRYVGSLENTYDIRGEKGKKMAYINKGDWLETGEKYNIVEVDGEELIYGKMIHTDL